MNDRATKPSLPSRLWRALPALLVALLLVGCGLDTIFGIARKVTGSDPARLAPSWPLDLRLEFTELKPEWRPVQKFLDDSAASGSQIATSSDETGIRIWSPPATDVPPIDLGKELQNPSPSLQDIATKEIGIPISAQTVPGVTVRLADTPAGQAAFVFDDGTGPRNVTLAQAKQMYPSLALPSAASLDYSNAPAPPQDIPDVSQAKLESGLLSVPISNDTAGDVTISVVLKDGANRQLGSKTTTLPGRRDAFSPPSTDSILIDLAGKTIDSPLFTAVTTTGTIPAGTPMANIKPDTDAVSVGPVTLVMDASEALVHLGARQGTDPNAKGYEPSLQDDPQNFEVTNQFPPDSGIKKVTAVKVSSGSLTIKINNMFAVDCDLRIRFPEITGISSASGPVDVNGDGSLTMRVDSNTEAEGVISLVGAEIRPAADGTITAVVSPATLDTDSDRTLAKCIAAGQCTLPNPPLHRYVPVTKRDYLAGSVLLSALRFERVTGTFDRTQELDVQEIPIPMPKEIADTGVQPARISIKLIVENKSMIEGTLVPAITGVASDGTLVKVELETGSPTPPREAFKGDFKGGKLPGASESTTIEINERNSNIIDVLSGKAHPLAGRISPALAKAAKLRFGGTTHVIGDGATLTDSDRIGAKVEISIPMAVTVEAFGPGTRQKSFPYGPIPIEIDDATRKQMQSYVTAATVELRIENGWGLPLTLGALLSTESIPAPPCERNLDCAPFATGSAAIARNVSTGAGPLTLSVFELTPSEAKHIGSLRSMGLLIGSPGTTGKIIQLRDADVLKVRVSAKVRMRVGPELATGLNK